MATDAIEEQARRRHSGPTARHRRRLRRVEFVTSAQMRTLRKVTRGICISCRHRTMLEPKKSRPRSVVLTAEPSEVLGGAGAALRERLDVVELQEPG